MKPIGYLHPYGVSGLKQARKSKLVNWGTACHPTPEAWGIKNDPVKPVPVFLAEEMDTANCESVSYQAQADAWRSLLEWAMGGESNADGEARRCYAQAMIEGTEFEDWYEGVSGREQGYNMPPPAILMVLRPYLLGSVTE
ncbi:hypothetical protein [Propionivibrio sp.]|uniref:hypothetical protein n=1 Tax=Propionivibrio sp. TaxID=2212460 RepID=UPI003BEF6071